MPLLTFSLLGLALVGCPTATPSEADAPTPPIDMASAGPPRSPDGTGYCCPHETPSCDCTDLGGYSADGRCDLLRFQTVCDAVPYEFVLHTDEHGCEYYTAGPSSCLARPDTGPDLRFDAGPEVETDTGTETVDAGHGPA